MYTYSFSALNLCNEFDEFFNQKKHLKKTKSALAEKQKLSKLVYYYGIPKNLNCTEYFTDKSQIKSWIKKKLFVNFNLENLIYSQLVLVTFSLNWQWTFHLTEHGCKYFGSAFCSNDVYMIPCLNYKVFIYLNNCMTYDTFTLCTLDFEGPEPELQTMQYKDGITQFINIKWNNTNTLPYKPDNDLKKIKCINYLIRVYSKNDDLIAQIVPNLNL